jgi:hypothetical protein
MSTIPSFILYGKNFHKIEKVIKAKNKIYEIQDCSQSFFFSDIQLLLISKIAFEFILKNNQPFIIRKTEDISQQSLINCFEQLYSLLSSSSSLFMSNENVRIYQYLAKVLNNNELSLICDEVESLHQTKEFILKSTFFKDLNQEIESKINNFEIHLKNSFKIKCNDILASLLSNQIMKIFGKSNFIDFSSFEYPSIIIDLFSILKGTTILLNNLNLQNLIETIFYLEMEDEIFQDFIHFSIKDLTLLSESMLNKVLHSPFLQLFNESELFQYILTKFEEKRNNVSLLQYIYFGVINLNTFLLFISSIQFSEISNEIFENFKETFYSTFLNYKENFIPKILSSSVFENFNYILLNYLQMHRIVDFPIDISLF